MPHWSTAICRLYHGHPARGGGAQGTACFVAPDRLLTAAHLLREVPLGEVYLRGLPGDAIERVVEARCHPTLDLAWLRIGAPQPVCPLRPDPRPLPAGATLTLCGFPDPDSGLRTARHRLIARDGGFQLGVVQGAPAKGFSGGPALLAAAWAGGPAERDGWLGRLVPPRLVGICAARHQDRSEGLIVPLAAALEWLPDLTPPPPRQHRWHRIGLAALAVAALVVGGGLWLAGGPPTQPLAGSVRDADGAPITGVAVALPEYDLTTTTDALGRFRFAVPAPAGTLVELLADSPQHRGHRDYAAAGTTGLGILLERRPP